MLRSFYLYLACCLSMAALASSACAAAPDQSEITRAEAAAGKFLAAQKAEDWDKCIEMLDPKVKVVIKSKDSILASLRPLPQGTSATSLPTRNYFKPGILIQDRQIKQGSKWLDVVIVVRKSMDGQWKVLFCHPSRLESIFASSMSR